MYLEKIILVKDYKSLKTVQRNQDSSSTFLNKIYTWLLFLMDEYKYGIQFRITIHANVHALYIIAVNTRERPGEQYNSVLNLLLPKILCDMKISWPDFLITM